MNKQALVALTCAATLLATPALHASPVTYEFTGVTFAAGALDGQTITGTYTYDAALYTRHASDGATWGQSWIDGAPVGSAAGAFHLSGGYSGGFGGSDSPFGVSFQTIVQKGFVRPDVGAVDAFEVYGTSSNGANGFSVLELLTQQPAARPDLIFPGSAPGDFSPTQPVSFLTPGSLNVGYFAEFTAGGAIVAAGDFSITRIAAVVPEAPASALMMAGLAVVALGRRRKQAATAA